MGLNLYNKTIDSSLSLAQLNSACHMLHDIFFQKTTAQRMEIIATDRRIQRRKMLQAKAALDASKLRPPNAEQQRIVAASDSSRSVNKLSRISL